MTRGHLQAPWPKLGRVAPVPVPLRASRLRVPGREREILSRMTQLNPGPLDTVAVEKIYQNILNESIRIQVQHGLGKAELPAAETQSSTAKQPNHRAKPRKAVSA